jgi:hypothetical protein
LRKVHGTDESAFIVSLQEYFEKPKTDMDYYYPHTSAHEVGHVRLLINPGPSAAFLAPSLTQLFSFNPFSLSG